MSKEICGGGSAVDLFPLPSTFHLWYGVNLLYAVNNYIRVLVSAPRRGHSWCLQYESEVYLNDVICYCR